LTSAGKHDIMVDSRKREGS